MLLPRRALAADPAVVARLSGLRARGSGWVPPPAAGERAGRSEDPDVRVDVYGLRRSVTDACVTDPGVPAPTAAAWRPASPRRPWGRPRGPGRHAAGDARTAPARASVVPAPVLPRAEAPPVAGAAPGPAGPAGTSPHTLVLQAEDDPLRRWLRELPPARLPVPDPTDHSAPDLDLGALSAGPPREPRSAPAGHHTRPGETEQDEQEVAVPRRTPPGAVSPLARWREGRLDPGHRGVAVLAVVAVLAAVLAGVAVLRSRPTEVVPPSVVATGQPVPGSSAAATPTGGSGEVVVSVGGKVPRPGLVRLPTGSRVDDALTAAGGATPDADISTLNLARRLVDGEQVLVGIPQPPGAPLSSGAMGSSAGGLLDLNTATLEQFDDLPGIGPVLAQKILDWRTENGRFGSVDQLREVSGIGEAKYAELKPRVQV